MLPEEISFEKVKAERLELDKIVLRDILGLSEKEHLEVYQAVVDLVKSRLEKAKSVGKKSKKSEASLGSTFGEYYADKTLSQGQENLAKRELIGYSGFGETRIEQDLFGWKIHTQRRVFEFDSELEARYCLVFLELGWRKVLIPTDLNYLAEILPRLEYLKMRADEIIGNGLKKVFGRKIRWDARIKTYQKISIIPDDAPKFDMDEFADFDEEEEDYDTEEDFDEETEEEYA